MSIELEICEKVKEYVEAANNCLMSFGKSTIPPIEIVFSRRRSRTSGFAKARLLKTERGYRIASPVLKFNLRIAEPNMEKFLTVTVPHEVAHLMSYIYGSSGHDRIWKSCCRAIGLENAQRLSDYKLEGYVEYTCPCGHIFYLTQTMSRKIESGHMRRSCTKCGGVIFKKESAPVDKTH